MPVQFFSEAERARLSRFPTEIPLEDCITAFTLSPDDLVETRLQRGPQHRLGFALQMGSIRYMGFAPDDLLSAPQTVITYVARQLDVDPGLLPKYARRRHTRSDHLIAVLKHLKWHLPTAEDLAALETWLVERALEHDSPSVLFELASAHLKSQCIVRPGVTLLERLIAAARDQAHAETQRRLMPLLTQALIAQLDQLLIVNPETNRPPVTWLRQTGVANTPEEINATLDKVRFLQEMGVPEWDLSSIPPNRLKWLTAILKHATNQAFSRTPPATLPSWPFCGECSKNTLISSSIWSMAV